MKKNIAKMLLCAMLLSLVSCGGTETVETTAETIIETAEKYCKV